MRRIFTEPLLLFAVLGGALAVVWHFVSPERPVEVIEIAPETVAALVQREEELLGRKASEEERDSLVESHIDDEVLLREARKAGLTETDGRVRKRLLGVMRYGLLDPVQEPSRQQLEAFYNENRERYLKPPSVVMEQVFFGWESDKLPDDPDAFLGVVREAENPSELNDSLFAPTKPVEASRGELVNGMGAAFADAVEAIEPSGGWHGPIESTRGIHYVRVLERRPEEMMPFETVEPFLSREWQFLQSREAQQKKVEEMRKRYRVVVPEN